MGDRDWVFLVALHGAGVSAGSYADHNPIWALWLPWAVLVLAVALVMPVEACP